MGLLCSKMQTLQEKTRIVTIFPRLKASPNRQRHLNPSWRVLVSYFSAQPHIQLEVSLVQHLHAKHIQKKFYCFCINVHF